MSNTSLTLRELIERIESSVKDRKIDKDYPYFLRSFRDLGISSYILNTIIIKAKERCDNNDNYYKDIDHSFFVHYKLNKSQKHENTPHVQERTIIVRKTSKTAWLLMVFLLVCCTTEAVYISIDRDRHDNELERLNAKNTELREKIAQICNMTSTLSDDLSFSDWHSTNHTESSESQNNYTFTALKGDKLSFEYYVSSEENYDYLTIKLSGDSIYTKELVKISGDSLNLYSFVFEKNGKYNLQVKYSKDGTINKNKDNAGISNINLYSNYKSILNGIHSISCAYGYTTHDDEPFRSDGVNIYKIRADRNYTEQQVQPKYKAVTNTVKDCQGHTYPVVKIGNQYWMAENLQCTKYDTQSERAGATLSTSSSSTDAPYYTDGRNATTEYSGNLTSSQRKKLGLLYNWAAAVGLATESEAKNRTTAFSGRRQGICPNGWHIPTDAEWIALGIALGGTKDSNGLFSDVGKRLKTTSGWYDGGHGTDDYSFAALPAGYAFESTVSSMGVYAQFWTSTSDDSHFADYRYMRYDNDYLASGRSTKSNAVSVRCVRN